MGTEAPFQSKWPTHYEFIREIMRPAITSLLDYLIVIEKRAGGKARNFLERDCQILFPLSLSLSLCILYFVFENS